MQNGPAPRHARDHLAHEALLYASADELVAAAVPFLREGLWGGELLFQVSGNAPIRAPFPGQVPPRLDSEGGRGLWLARQLCELLQVRSTPDGSVIRLHFVLPRRARPAAQKRGGSV